MLSLLVSSTLALFLAGSAPQAPDPAQIKVDVEFLCSPDLAGRKTGTPGAEKAATYVADRMRTAGLAPIKAGGLGGESPYHYQWTYYGSFQTEASNVVGVVPGTDPALMGEYVYITAHFDHLGMRWGEMYPGADDDASGTAALMALMDLLKHAQPKRSIAFLAVSGEEEHLLGSEAYLRNPPLPVDTIKAEINMDMIGRGRAGQLHVMPTTLDGAVTTLVQDARATATRQGLPLSAGFDNYWRYSDHYSFARRGIPSVCFSTGLHKDYHQPTDTPEKIDYGKIAAVVSILRDLALTTANAAEAPTVVPKAVWETWAWEASDPVPVGALE